MRWRHKVEAVGNTSRELFFHRVGDMHRRADHREMSAASRNTRIELTDDQVFFPSEFEQRLRRMRCLDKNRLPLWRAGRIERAVELEEFPIVLERVQFRRIEETPRLLADDKCIVSQLSQSPRTTSANVW
jgi:hypothetical protein